MAAMGRVTIQHGADYKENTTAPKSGNVGNAVRRWLVYEDQMVANQMQNEEFQQHFDKNRQNRRTVREDIPVARQVFSEEEARLQYERMRQLEQQKQVTERDEEMAREIQSQLEHRNTNSTQQLHDQAVQRHLQALRAASAVQGQINQRAAGDNQELARREQMRESRSRPDTGAHGSAGYPHNQQVSRERSVEHRFSDYDDEFDEEVLEAEDRELAVRLQQEEEERYERKKQQRLLAKERKRLERLIDQQQNQLQQQNDPGGSAGRRGGPTAGEDDGDFSDFYIPPDPRMSPDESRRLQEEQDAELARLIQDQESKRSRSDVLRDRLRNIENQDAELARIIQEEEKLRAKRRALKHRQKILQQQREVAERIATGSSPNHTLSSTGSSGREAPQHQSQPAPQTRVAAHHQQSIRREESDYRSGERPIARNNDNRSSDHPIRIAEPTDRYPSSVPAKPAMAQFSNSSNMSGTTPTKTEQRDSLRSDHQNLQSHPRASSPPSTRSKHANIPLALPDRLIQNRELDQHSRSAEPVRTQATAPTSNRQDVNAPSQISGRTGHPGAQANYTREAQPAASSRAGGDMYGERPVARSGYSPDRARDLSPPGPALPERRYRDDISGDEGHSPNGRLRTSPNVHSGAQAIPPYREQRPPPYPVQSRLDAPAPINTRMDSGHFPPPSPRSAETHYDTPWDLSQIEDQLMRDAASSTQTQVQGIKPRKIDAPGRRGESHRQMPGDTQVGGPGGRPLLEQNERGTIVMNIAEMIDPTYPKRQSRSSIAEPHTHSSGLEVEGEITAVAGQRRSGSKRGGQSKNRESCKQQ